MNITKRTIWKLDLGDRGHWIQRACEDIGRELGIDRVDLDDVAFATPEAAVGVGERVLQKLVERTPYCHTGFADKKDDDKALAEVGMSGLRHLVSSAGARQESRWAADPQITWDPVKGSIVIERTTEVRWVTNRTVRREIQVEGETWIRDVVEVKESGWYRGSPEVTVFHVWSEELVEIG
jgi:hypothetical protein